MSYPIGWDWDRESIRQVENFKSIWIKQEPKMTREEAAKKVDPITNSYTLAPYTGEYIVRVIEVLGLIKFEEVNPDYDTIRIYSGRGTYADVTVINAIVALVEHGYQVVKKKS